MSDVVIGYRGECNTCESFSYAESLAYVQDWAAKHEKSSGHTVTITTARAYNGPIVHHDKVIRP